MDAFLSLFGIKKAEDNQSQSEKSDDDDSFEDDATFRNKFLLDDIRSVSDCTTRTSFSENNEVITVRDDLPDDVKSTNESTNTSDNVQVKTDESRIDLPAITKTDKPKVDLGIRDVEIMKPEPSIDSLKKESESIKEDPRVDTPKKSVGNIEIKTKIDIKRQSVPIIITGVNVDAGTRSASCMKTDSIFSKAEKSIESCKSGSVHFSEKMTFKEDLAEYIDESENEYSEIRPPLNDGKETTFAYYEKNVINLNKEAKKSAKNTPLPIPNSETSSTFSKRAVLVDKRAGGQRRQDSISNSESTYKDISLFSDRRPSQNPTIDAATSFKLSQTYGALSLKLRNPTATGYELILNNLQELVPPNEGGPKAYQLHITDLPSKAHRFKSREIAAGNPVIDEIYSFVVQEENAFQGTSIRFRLYHSKYNKALKVISEKTVPLADLAKFEEVDNVIKLTEKSLPYGVVKYNQKTAEGEYSKVDDKPVVNKIKESLRRGSNFDGQIKPLNILRGKSVMEIQSIKLSMAYNAVTGHLIMRIQNANEYENLTLKSKYGYYFEVMLKAKNDQLIKVQRSDEIKDKTFNVEMKLNLPMFQLRDVSIVINMVVRRNLMADEVVGSLSMGLIESNSSIQNHWIDTQKHKGKMLTRVHEIPRPI